MIHWPLTSAQFQAVLFATGRDRLPYPIRNIETTDSGTSVGERRRAAIEALLPRVDDDLAHAVQVLVEPRVRLHIDGHSGADTTVRAYAGFADSVAAVAVQVPDSAPDVSGDVTVTLCGHGQAMRLLTRLLPAQRPGDNRLVGLKADLDIEPDWVGGWSRPPTLRERIERFRILPRTGQGEVLAFSGPFLDNNVDGVTGFHWMDLANDGRYYVREDSAGYTITPMGEAQFAEHIGALVRRVRELTPVTKF